MLYPIITRSKQWWQPKAGNLLSAVYLSVYVFNIDFLYVFKYFFPAVITIFGIGLFGHFLNDFSDLESDKKAKKSNMLEKLSTNNRFLLFICSLLLAFLPWLFLPFDTVSCALIAGEFLLLFAYALPLIRFKERGFLALITDALYAYAIPFVLAFHTFNLLSSTSINWVLYAVLFLWQFSIGMLNILIHQIEDFENDLYTQTRTWVTTIGKGKARKYLLFCFWPMMILFFIMYLTIVSITSVSWYYTFPLLFLMIQFILVFYKKPFFAFVQSKSSADLQKINLHYHLFLPYWNLLLLVFIDIRFILVLFAHYFTFNYKQVFWVIKSIIYPYLFAYLFVNIPSKIVNFSIYYFRVFVLRESSKLARREHYENYIKEKKDRLNKAFQPNIAIVSANKSKYTETFIYQHEKNLVDAGYYLHRFYGGYMPTTEVKRGSLLSSNDSIRKFHEWKTAFFDKGENHYLKKQFVDYLIHNNINLVLAEFGQSGAEIARLCKEAGVPLIVVFYGYDAHHKNVIEQFHQKYIYLFEYASKVICVSNDILNKLTSLGAPSQKLMYLPCAFDLKKFKYSDHSQNAPIFLSVGRFSETKSPHLTILAFNEVLKEIPNAQLIMIGKDGGGELFEACHILVRALQIENNVVFKGICTPEEVHEQMNIARVFVQHSLTTPLNGDKEGTPVAIMEAMACGLPVISTHHAGIEELIITGENGFLVKEYDFINMAKMMINVAKDDALIQKIGLNAATSILNNKLIIDNNEILLNVVSEYIL